MVDTPAAKAEKTTPPPGGGETTPPVAETETISKDELTRLRNKIGATERLLQEAQATIAAGEAKAQLETLVQQLAEKEKVDPNLLMKIAPKLTKEELEDYAKDLPKAGEKVKQGLALNSTRSSGAGSGKTPSLEELRASKPEETAAKVKSGEWNLPGWRSR